MVSRFEFHRFWRKLHSTALQVQLDNFYGLYLTIALFQNSQYKKNFGGHRPEFVTSFHVILKKFYTFVRSIGDVVEWSL